MTPTVSVIMSVRNASAHLREAVESVLGQTFRDVEYIFINDGSTDDSASILASYAATDHRIRIITNEHSIGLTKSLNKGGAASKGKYLARMDADDISYPERFAQQVVWLDAHPECGVVAAWADVIDDAGKKVDAFEWETDDRAIKQVLIWSNVIIHPLAMIRRSVFEQAGGYDESFQYSQDYDLWLRLVPTTQFAVIPTRLLAYRIGTASITVSNNRAQRRCAIRAQWRAIAHGVYPLYRIFSVIKTAFPLLLPRSVTRSIKSLYT